MRRAFLLLVVALVLGSALPAHARPYWKRQIDHIVAGKRIGVSLRDHGRFLYRHNDRTKRAPASNEKLLMSMALYKKLGTNARIETRVSSAKKPVARIVAGNVYLSSKGDPSITAGGRYGRSLPFAPTTLGVLARAIAKTTDRIEGSVIGNTGYYDHDWFAQGWSSNFPADEVPLATSLTFDGNTYRGNHIKNPEWRAAKALTRKLEYFGVNVSGRPKAALMPDKGVTLASTNSVPISEMVRYMNRTSSNFFAEMFGKRLGAETFGAPGSIAKGASAIERYARRRGVTLSAHDASGLSYSNRVAPSGMVKLLGQTEAAEPFYEVLRRGLPTGGQGTLEDRLHGVKLRAKTGSLNAVSALSGWIFLKQTQSWAEFSIMSSGMSYYPSKGVEDRIVRVIEDLAR
jgi:D-alanyl-D-alanine carboxypeptidase